MPAYRYEVLFAPELVPLILSGEKTLTYRLDDDGLDYLRPGDIVEAINSQTLGLFARLQVTSVEFTSFGDLPTDRHGNVSHESKEQQRAVFRGYYGRVVSDDERVLVLGLRLLTEGMR